MKKIFISFLTLLIIQIQTFAVVIPEETVITIKPKNLIDADKVKEGNSVYFETIYPVKIKGKCCRKNRNISYRKSSKKKK